MGALAFPIPFGLPGRDPHHLSIPPIQILDQYDMKFTDKRDDVRVFSRIVEQVGDPRLVVELIRQRIAELNSNGEEVPEELLWIQNHYVDECIYSSQSN
ncbi:MAG: hypothetical protein ACR2PG_05660 [Hyphomicrobiaceae bacterium]